MTDDSKEGRNRPRAAFGGRRMLLALLGLVVVIGLLALVVHTPPVRRMVLGYTLSEVQRRFGVRLEASRLDYNLFALSVGLADLRAAADRPGVEPFFEAEYVRVSLPSRALTGVLAFDEISVAKGRVRVLRGEDGQSNLPETSDSPVTGEPPALNVARFLAPGLAVDVRDVPAQLTVAVPNLDVDISSTQPGPLVLRAPASISVGAHSTKVVRLEGRAAFDGRALKLSTLVVQADEGEAQVEGTLSLLVSTPSVDVHATGTAALDRLVAWARQDDQLPRGDVSFDASVAGPFGSPTTLVNVTSPRIQWTTMTLNDVAVTSRVTTDAADISDLRLSFAGGAISASGRVPFDDSSAAVRASLRDIDALALTKELAGPSRFAPTGRVSGDIEGSGPLAQPTAWTANARIRVDGGSTAPGRIAVPGLIVAHTMDGQWSVDAKQRLGGEVPLSLIASGKWDNEVIANSTLTGSVEVPSTSAKTLLSVLAASGLVSSDESVVDEGTVSARAQLSGRLRRPLISADVKGLELAGAQWRVAELGAMVSGDPLAPNLMLSASAPSATVADQSLERVTTTGRLVGDVLYVDSLSAAQAQTPGRLEASGQYGLSAERYDATLDVSEWRLLNPAGQPFEGLVAAQFRGMGSLDDPAGNGWVVVSGASWDQRALGDLTADLRFAEQRANVVARAGNFNATLTSNTSTQAPYQTTADLRADDVDLQTLEFVKLPVPVAGRATLALHAEGALETWQHMTATLDVASIDATIRDLPVRLTEPAHIRYMEERIHVDRLELDAASVRVSATGDLPRTSGGTGEVMLEARGDVGDVARAVSAAGMVATRISDGSGPLTLTARLTGSLEAPVVVGDLAVGPASVTLEELSTASDLRLRAHLENDVVNLQEAHASYEGAELMGTGSIPVTLFTDAPTPSTAPLTLHATATSLSPAVLRGVLDPSALQDFDAIADVEINLETPSLDMTRATGDVTITSLDLLLAGLSVTQTEPTRLIARDGFARIESWDWAGEGATVQLAGQVRLSDRQAALLANGDIDLRVLTPFLRAARIATAGRLTPRISLTGPIDNPRVDGDVRLDNGEVRVLDPRLIVNSLTGRASLSRRSATLTELTGILNGGALTGFGTIEDDGNGAIVGRLETKVEEMALDFPAGLRSELNADLALDLMSGPGTEPASGLLSGTVTVVSGEYREPLAVVGGFLSSLQARQDVTAQESSEFMKRLALQIQVQTDDDIIVDNNYARVQLGVDVDVVGTAAAPAVTGRMDLREDGQVFVGRNVYTVRPDPPSTIDFTSPVTIAPDLKLHLATRAGGEDIEVDVTGPVESPAVAMSSSGGLGQADITSLLLTGRPLEELNSADAAFIGTQVIGNFSGEVLGFAGRAFGLDTLRLGGVQPTGDPGDPASVATAVDPTSRLTFTKNLRSDVDLTYSQSLRDATDQTWIVDYLPTRRATLRFVNGDDNLRTYSFRHDVSFGGGVAPGARRAATPRQAGRVESIAITGNLVFPEAQIRDLLKLDEGSRFDFGRWQDDHERVEAFYHQNERLEARVTASRAINGDVVRLSYIVDAGPRTTIAVAGATLGRDVLQRIEEEWSAGFFDELLTSEAIQIVRGSLADQGFLRPTVTARVTTGTGAKTLQIAVTPNAPTGEARAQLQGVEGELRADIESRIDNLDLIETAVRDPQAVEADLSSYLRSRGYLRASVSVRPTLIEGGAALVPIVIEPGAEYLLNRVGFEGSEGVSLGDLTMAAGLMLESPYGLAFVENARTRLLTLYRSRGFATAAVTPNIAVLDPAPRVDVTFAIQEGPRQIVSDVLVAGNANVDEDVITRALELEMGVPLSPQELANARTRVYDTGLFRRVDVSTEPVEGPAAGGVQPMHVRVAVEAWPALRLRYGFQAIEEHPEEDPNGRALSPGVVADLTRRTLFGRAVGVGATVQIQHLENLGRGVVTAPTFLSLPIQSSLLLERRHREFTSTTLVTNTTTYGWEQKLRRMGHLTLSYSYRFERNHTFDTAPTIGVPALDIGINLARLIGTAAWDTRNDPFDALRGSLYSSSLQWAPARLGSSVRFIKYTGQVARFQEVSGAVLASSIRIGLVRPLGLQELFTGEKFFSGGSRTVRGVPEDTLGARDFFGDPAGGGGFVVLNGEARVPIRPLQRWLRGVAFIDAGNVYPRVRDVSLRDLTGSMGVGIRITTPFALLRADFGKVVWGPPEVSRTGRWSFGIGQAF